jgi:hypothetical protein
MSRNNKKYHIFEINVGKLNLVCIALFVVIVLLTSFLYRGNIIEDLTEVNLMLLILVNVALMLVHELLHSLAYVIYGGDFKKIVYGAYLEKGVLYCLCKQNITRKNILNALMFPLFYIGIIPYIIAIIINQPFLLFLAIMNIVGAVGDIMMFAYIKSLPKDIEFSEFDNPIRFAIYTDKDIKVRFFGLDYIETKRELERTNFKKITISKGTYIATIVLVLLTILSFFI